MTDRIKWIDTAKGIGILCVLLGHVNYPYLQTIIYTFHMPLFFFLSGFLFSGNKYNTTAFIKNKIRTLVVPYYFWAFFYFIPIDIIFRLINDKNIDFSSYKDFIIMGRKETIWFLGAMFCVSIIMYFLAKFLKNNIYFILFFSAIMFIIFAVYYYFGGKALWFNLDVAFMALPFFALGYYLSMRRQVLEKINKITPFLFICLIFLFLSINFIVGYLNKKISSVKVDMSQNSYGNLILMFVSAIAGIIVVVLISQKIHFKFISYLGQNSIIYFIMHQKIYTIIANFVYPIFHFNEGANIINNTISLFLLPAISIIIITFFNYIFTNSRLCIFIGKNYLKKNK